MTPRQAEIQQCLSGGLPALRLLYVHCMQDDHNKVLNTLHREGKLPAPSDSQPAVLIQVGHHSWFQCELQSLWVGTGPRYKHWQETEWLAVCCEDQGEEDSIPEYG